MCAYNYKQFRNIHNMQQSQKGVAAVFPSKQNKVVIQNRVMLFKSKNKALQ